MRRNFPIYVETKVIRRFRAAAKKEEEEEKGSLRANFQRGGTLIARMLKSSSLISEGRLFCGEGNQKL